MEPRATRVADVQRQTLPMLALACGFTLAAPVAALLPHRTGSWLPLHLFLVGGLVSAIAGATQMLAVTWSTAPAPRDRLALIQRCLIVTGVVALAAGRETESSVLVGGGGVAMVVLIVLLIVSLTRIRNAAATDRFHPAIDAYAIAFAWVLLGVLGGVALATDPTGAWWIRLRDAHVAANTFGFVGNVIAATLPYFVATQARMKMSRRATSARQRAVLVWLVVAVVITAAGHLGATSAISGAGYLGYSIGICITIGHLPPVRARQIRWAGPRLVQLGTGIAWWVAGSLALALHEFGGPVDQPTALRVIAVGGFAQILIASLAYFGPVLRGGGHQRLTAGFTITRSWVSLAAGNAAALSLSIDAQPAATVAIAVWVADTVIRSVRLLRPRRTPSEDATHSARMSHGRSV